MMDKNKKESGRLPALSKATKLKEEIQEARAESRVEQENELFGLLWMKESKAPTSRRERAGAIRSL